MTASLSHDVPARFELATADTWAATRGRCTARCATTTRCTTSSPTTAPTTTTTCCPGTPTSSTAARDHETFSSAQGLTVNYGELEMIGLADNPPMVMQDPPVHTEFRKLVSRGFTPRQVEAVEPEGAASSSSSASSGSAPTAAGDIVAELFKPLPSMVVAHYLGVPEEDRSKFDGWTEAIVAANTAEGGIAGALRDARRGGRRR